MRADRRLASDEILGLLHRYSSLTELAMAARIGVSQKHVGDELRRMMAIGVVRREPSDGDGCRWVYLLSTSRRMG